MRRARRFEVSGCFFDQMFTARPREGALFRGVTSDAPEDMRITGVSGYDPDRDVWTFVCESAVFEPLGECEIPPLFTPAFTAHYDGG